MLRKQAITEFRKTIEQQGQVHLLRIIRKHLTEAPKTDDKLPTVRQLVQKKWEKLGESKKEIGYFKTYEVEKNRLLSKFDEGYEKLIGRSASLDLKSLAKGFSRISGIQWGFILPPRNLKFQHPKLEQHFILLRKVPIFIAEVSSEWWNTMFEQTLRKNLDSEDRDFLLQIHSLLLDFQKGFDDGRSLHSIAQQFFSLKLEVSTSKDLTLTLDPFSFQMLERFFASLLNPPRESE